MSRAVLAVIACLALAGCWISDHRIFGAGDWAHLGLAGNFKSENAAGEGQAKVTLTTRADGLIDGTSVSLEDGKTERSVLGLVPIRGGSGKYFIAVDRSADDDSGEIYMIAHLTDEGGLEVYWPDCAGTSPVKGMTRQEDEFTHTTACSFASKDALMAAGLEAEKFLSARHVVEIAPFGRLVPDEGEDEDRAAGDGPE